jgi:hypothetical protein
VNLPLDVSAQVFQQLVAEMGMTLFAQDFTPFLEGALGLRLARGWALVAKVKSWVLSKLVVVIKIELLVGIGKASVRGDDVRNDVLNDEDFFSVAFLPHSVAVGRNEFYCEVSLLGSRHCDT